MADAIVILGATSAIGRAFAEEMAREGHPIVLAARDLAETRRIASDLTIRFEVTAAAIAFDALSDTADPAWFSSLLELCTGRVGGLFLCYGAMYDEDEMRSDATLAARMIAINYTTAGTLLERFADVLYAQESGWICVVTSVAGDRGRPSNYVYGSSKAALSTWVSGLRARLSKRGVRVVDLRPGFVDTSLTYGRPGLFLVARPSSVARSARKAIERDRAVAYAPFFWRTIMWVIRQVPDVIFKRLSL